MRTKLSLAISGSVTASSPNLHPPSGSRGGKRKFAAGASRTGRRVGSGHSGDRLTGGLLRYRVAAQSPTSPFWRFTRVLVIHSKWKSNWRCEGVYTGQYAIKVLRRLRVATKLR